MTAEYLLHCQHTEQKFIVTNGADMANWLLGEIKPNDGVSKARKGKYVLAETNEALFEIKYKIKGIKVTKVKLNPEWAKHFRLIEVGSDKKWGQIFFSDSGSSEYLKENFF